MLAFAAPALAAASFADAELVPAAFAAAAAACGGC